MKLCSFLCLGFFCGMEGFIPSAAAGETPAERRPISQAETAHAVVVAANLAELWSDPAGRESLEPVGSFHLLSNRREPPAVAAANQQWQSDATWRALVEALLARGDRMSVRAALNWMSWKSDPVWLDRAVALFPDEPEILLTKAMKNPDSPGARELFLRGLALTRSIVSFSGDAGYMWGSLPQSSWWRETAVVTALAEKAVGLENRCFPPAWCKMMVAALTDPVALQALPHPDKVAQGLLRHFEPFPDELRDSPWPEVLENLLANGYHSLAQDCAVALLRMPQRPLYSSTKGWLLLAPPWRTGARVLFPHRATFGWHLMRTAAGDRPAELASALQAALTQCPADEALAFHVLLAQGLARPLTAEDLPPSGALTKEQRQRIIAFASQLLPPSRLPAALCADAVAEEIRRILALNAHPEDEQPILTSTEYLDRMNDPAASSAVARLLPLLFRERARLAKVNLPSLTAKVLRQLSPENRRTYVAAWLAEFVRDHPPERQLPALDLLLKGWLAAAPDHSAPEPLPELAALLGEILSGPASRSVESEVQSAFASLCLTAFHFPAWQPEVRRLAALDLPGDDWAPVHRLIGMLDNEAQPPDVVLDFQPGAPGQGTLTWYFTKVGIPAVSWSEAGHPLTNPLLAAVISREFDAVISMDDGSGGPARPLKRINPRPFAGSVLLTNLLYTGKLSFQLVRKSTGQKTKGVHRVFFNTRPAIIKIERDALPKPPAGPLTFLAPPVPCGNSQAWQITVPPGDKMEAFRPVLLDAAGRIHAAPAWNSRPQSDPQIQDQPNGWIIRKRWMHADSPWKQPATASPLKAVGPPVSLGLIATRQLEQFRGDGDHLPRPVRITVQPLPDPMPVSDAEVKARASMERLIKEGLVEPGQSFPLQGRLEPTRLWTPDRETTGHIFLCGEPPKAIWFRRNSLLMVDPLRDQPPVSFPLPLPELQNLKAGAWLGGKLWLLLTPASTNEGDLALTTLLAVDPFQPSVPVETRVFPGHLMPGHDPISPGIPALILEHYVAGIDSVITASGQFLTMDAAARRGRIFQMAGLLSATRLYCRPGADGLTPVIDWQSGSLRVTYCRVLPESDWQPSDYPLWRDASSDFRCFGLWMDHTKDANQLWEESLKLDFLRPLSVNYLLGTSNGSLVRLRKVPFPHQ